jgi:lipoyl(octanoyl) transferase
VEAVIRLLPYAFADGPTNMAADETLVHSAAAGIASLRFYGWTAATVSLGYFQPAAVRLVNPRLASLPWVRRPSGGAMLVHHHEITYCLALPHGALWQAAEPWLLRMHRIIAAALGHLGLAAEPVRHHRSRSEHGDILCFHQHTLGDLLSGANKIVGSAQRKYRQALMQHGSILLAQSQYTPDLLGIRETAGATLTPSQVEEATLRAFAAETGWRFDIDDWHESERASIRELATEKYATAAWNERR